MKRKVEKETLVGATSIFGAFKFYYWDLLLECGHQADRRCRYNPDPSRQRQLRGYAALHHMKPMSLLKPAPKTVRCEDCADG